MSILANYGVFQFWQRFFDANDPNERNTLNFITTLSSLLFGKLIDKGNVISQKTRKRYVLPVEGERLSEIEAAVEKFIDMSIGF